MKTRKPPEVPKTASDPEQSERFIKAAREHGTDETGKAFERLFKKVAATKPKGKTK